MIGKSSPIVMYLNIVGEDLLFLLAATLFLAVVGWAWRKAKPYQLPEPLPSWFKLCFRLVAVAKTFALGSCSRRNLSVNRQHGQRDVVRD